MPRPVPGMKSTVKNPMQVLGRVIGYVFKYYKIRYILVFVLIVVTVLANVQGTMFMKSLIDDYIVPLMQQESPDFSNLANAILRVAGFYIIGVAASWTWNFMMVYITQGTMKNMRDEMFSHMQKLPVSYFDKNTRGDIMSIYTNDVDTLRQLVSQTIPQLFNSAFTIISVLVSMIILSIPLTILTLAMVGVVLFASGKLGGNSAKYFIAQQKDIGRLNGFVEETMAGQKVVKVFCHEEQAKEDFRKLNDTLFDSSYKANMYSSILFPVNAQLGYASYVLCAMLGGVLATTGVTGLTLGGLASFLTFNQSFSSPINQLSMQISSIAMALAGADRIFKLIDEPLEEDEGVVDLVCVEVKEGNIVESDVPTGKWAWRRKNPETGEIEYRKLRGDVVFKNVDFGYVPGKIVLHNINMYAHAGQKIAFVGSTGAGKTTITNLINRFYDINSGTITYDDIDISHIQKGDLRKSLGAVLQEVSLFTGTVADNIRFGKLDATDEEVIAAAKLANADPFIRRLPDGYNTVLTGNGAGLSQGQRQLLSIARAAVGNPPVLILDEATSSIDTRTERIVQEGMDRLMEGRTSFVIAHRLSTVKNADCIMVIEHGEIIERGTHDQLMEAKGRYYQLYTGGSTEGK